MNAQWKRRPKYAPREIRRKWPGITYPDPRYCQARHGRLNRCFSYSKHGSVERAHEAAAAWLHHVAPADHGVRVSAVHAVPSGSGNGVLYRIDDVRGIEQYSFRVAYRDPTGRKRTRTFFIGSEHTWTNARERAAFKAACKFRLAYEKWRIEGGVHPMDTNDHPWSAAEH